MLNKSEIKALENWVSKTLSEGETSPGKHANRMISSISLVPSSLYSAISFNRESEGNVPHRKRKDLADSEPESR